MAIFKEPRTAAPAIDDAPERPRLAGVFKDSGIKPIKSWEIEARARLRSSANEARVVEVDATFNDTIVIESAIASLLDTFLTRDILPALQTMTGRSFSTLPSSGRPGVVRVRTSGALAAQQYTITGTPVSDLVIEGGSWRGCKHGLYEWLRQLGVYQLAPGERFRVIPSRSDLRLSLSVNNTPAIPTIAWTAQGAPSGNLWPFGDGDDHLAAWYEFLDWNQRPIAHYTSVAGGTLPEKVPFGGHVDAFVYSDKQAEFDADATHFAQLNRSWNTSTVYVAGNIVVAGGKRYTCATGGTSHSSGSGPTGEGTGIADGTCVWDWLDNTTRSTGVGYFHMTHTGTATGTDYDGTTGVVGIYADWVGDAVDANVAGVGARPDLAGLEMTISAAVADGADYCKDIKCRDLIRNEFGGSTDATATDLSLWRAGKIYDIAKATRPSTSFKVADYAYDKQSAPPTTGLTVSPNLFVQLAQWLYATDGLPGRVLFDRWVARRDLDGFDLGIYDYWALSEHTGSDARFATSRAWRHFREWAAAGNVKSFFGESTFAIGAIGPQWWGALQMNMRGTGLTDAALLTEWCLKAFGEGAPHVRRMLERWWTKEWPYVIPHGYELGLAFDDLKLADTATLGDAGARSRVAAMMAYVVFLHYRFNWYDVSVLAPSPPSEAAAAAAAEPLLQWMWRTRATMMVDAKYLHDQIMASAHLSGAFKTQWAIPSDSGNWAAWRSSNNITDYTDTQIQTDFETLRTGTYTKPTAAVHTAAVETSLVTPYSPSGSSPVQTNWVYGTEAGELGHEYLFGSTNGGTLKIRAAATSTPAAVRIRLYNATTDALISQTDVTLPQNVETDHDIDLSGLLPGYYRVFVENHRGEISHSLLVRPDTPIVRVGSYGRILWNVGDAPTYPRFFFVPKGVTAFHIFQTNPDNLVVKDSTGATVSPSLISPYVRKYTVPAGEDQEVWRWEGIATAGSYPAHGTPKILDIPEWTSPTKEQMIVPSNLWLE